MRKSGMPQHQRVRKRHDKVSRLKSTGLHWNRDQRGSQPAVRGGPTELPRIRLERAFLLDAMSLFLAEVDDQTLGA